MKLSLRSIVSALLAAVIATVPFSANAQSTSDNYVGVGVADDGFVINGRVVIDDQLSIRPVVITNVDFGDDSEFTVLVPVTYDFENLFTNKRIQPFAGVGLGGTSKSDGGIGAIATGGSDYQLTDRLVANASINWLLFDDSDTAFIGGLGYRF